jgi:DNA gyrase subunit A
MLISTGGVLIRTRVTDIRVMSRSTQGVTLINLDDGTYLAGVEKVIETEEPEESEEPDQKE